MSMEVTKGCKDVAPAYLMAMQAFKSWRAHDIKDAIVKIFTTPDLLSAFDSDKCTLVSARMPRPGSQQVTQISCDAGADCFASKPHRREPRDLRFPTRNSVW